MGSHRDALEIEKDSCTTVNTEIVFPQYTSHIGTLFGGKLVEFMDITGALCAMRFAGCDVVTASIEALDFKMPIKQGDILELRADVIFSSKTSMIVMVDVYTRPAFSEDKDFACNGYFSFVAIDSDGRPKPIPKLKIEGEEQKALYERGKEIKQRAISRRN